MKTRNYTLLLFLFLGHVLSSQAGIVDQKTAAQVAENQFYQKYNQIKSPLLFSEVLIKDVFVKETQGEALYYAFDFEGGGFVIVSAEDNFTPIIGYALIGTFPANAHPESNYAKFMQTYSGAIIYVRTSNYQADSEIKGMWDHLLCSDKTQLRTETRSRRVEPLINSHWAQGDPYNLMCPEDLEGPAGHVVTGCGATCMSQILHYWRYPDVGTGSNTYYASSYGTQTANFGETYYDWNGMQNTGDNNYTFPIAQLMYHAGVSIDMNYGPFGSGASPNIIDDALRNNFRFGDATQHNKSDYTMSQWTDLLITDLDQQYPVYYIGYTTDGGGHAFVCDGYEGDDFHFNFGWGGSGDGYYTLYDVGGYHVDQICMNHVYPTDDDYPYFPSGTIELHGLSGSLTDGSGPILDYQNNTSAQWLIAPQTEHDSISDLEITFYQLDTDENDIVTLYDGSTTSDAVLGVFSGNSIPETIYSSGNEVLITFTSDANTTASGWYLEYNATRPSFCSGMQLFSENTGSISDGSGDFYYNNGSTCLWKIKPEFASEITLYFTGFETEEGKDILSIYDGTTLIAELSGNEIPDPLVATSGEMFITFTTNNTTNFEGWEAWYEINNVGVEKLEMAFDLNIYPNPAQNMLYVSMDNINSGNASIGIYNVAGMQVLNQKLKVQTGGNQFTIDISDLPSGVYFLRFNSNKQFANKRFIVG
jgi:Peptidase C10 family/Secretion system C-terminal sorting domain/Spi protease inhibitor/CUB domain